MHSATLFVSDLDGTLLRHDATLSPYARALLCALLEQGLPFTIATGRSVVSAQQILGDLPLRLPVICSNGACIADLASGHHFAIHAIEKPLDLELFYFLRDRNLNPFLSSYNGREEHLYIDHISNAGMSAYYGERVSANDLRLRQTPDLRTILNESILCINVIDRRDTLEQAEAALHAEFGGAFQTYVYADWYTPGWYWLSVYHCLGTKAAGIWRLAQERSLDLRQVMVFGDNFNDLPMFEAAGFRVAPANAIPEVLALADVVIGANETDSVVDYLAKTTGRQHLCEQFRQVM